MVLTKLIRIKFLSLFFLIILFNKMYMNKLIFNKLTLNKYYKFFNTVQQQQQTISPNLLQLVDHKPVEIVPFNKLNNTCSHIKEFRNILKPSSKSESEYINFGTEWLFTKIFKKIAKKENIRIIAEEKSFHHKNGNCYGRCDLWMHDIEHHYNISVELKCGSINDNTKINKLKEQTVLYTDIYKSHFPNFDTIGIGIYLHKDGLYILKYHKEKIIGMLTTNKINLLITKLKNELNFNDSNIEINNFSEVNEIEESKYVENKKEKKFKRSKKRNEKLVKKEKNRY